MIRARKLVKQVNSPEGLLTIIDNISLEIAAGQSMALLGASGSGKTTLLGLLAGLDLPSRGQVWLEEQELTSMDEDQRAATRAGRVGFVFQSFHLLPNLNALENVMLAVSLADRPEPAERARQWLDDVGLGHRLSHYPHQLSGGEQQRVALARAFAPEPRILFADEPTGNLDQGTGQRVATLMFDLNQRLGTTLVLVTHDPALARHCDRQLMLDGGRLSP